MNLTFDKSIELGIYKPETLTQYPEWQKYPRHVQFEFIQKGLANRRKQLLNQWMEINKANDYSIKPHLIEASENIDRQLKKLLADKEVSLTSQISEIDKKIREIYSKIIDRVGAEKEGRTEQQKKTTEERKKTEASAKENIQRQQWTGQPNLDSTALKNIPEAYKKKVEKSFEKEMEQRKQFIEDINKSDK